MNQLVKLIKFYPRDNQQPTKFAALHSLVIWGACFLTILLLSVIYAYCHLFADQQPDLILLLLLGLAVFLHVFIFQRLAIERTIFGLLQIILLLLALAFIGIMLFLGQSEWIHELQHGSPGIDISVSS
jgi:predicted MFS family arabinose efflux permease